MTALQDYAGSAMSSGRARKFRASSSPSPGSGCLRRVVPEMFRQLINDAASLAHARPPRMHDLRHTFAVRTLLGWYHAGEDVAARLPSLSTYLGHREPSSTYWYLSAAPELLAPWPPPAPGHRLVGGPIMTLVAPTLAGLLHRPARHPAPGEPAHHRGLPRHRCAARSASCTAGPASHRSARLGRPGRDDDPRVPRPPGERTHGNSIRTRNVRLTAIRSLFPTPPCATPSTPGSSRASSPSPRNASTSRPVAS